MQKNLNTNVYIGFTQKSKEIETVNHSPVKRQNETYICLCNGYYLTTTKKNEIPIHAIPWINLGNNMLSKKRHEDHII